MTFHSFDRDELAGAGFVGWLPFSDLTPANVPDAPGVYVVYRDSDAQPDFLDVSPAGTYKGKDPTVPTEVLRARWVQGARVVNIGKATSLRKRLNAYRRQGTGLKAGHFGGRYIWQCADASELLVAWKQVVGKPRDEEKRLLGLFRSRFGSLPFANLSN